MQRAACSIQLSVQLSPTPPRWSLGGVHDLRARSSLLDYSRFCATRSRREWRTRTTMDQRGERQVNGEPTIEQNYAAQNSRASAAFPTEIAIPS